MAEIKLKLKEQPRFPLEAEVITPDNFAQLKLKSWSYFMAMKS